VPSDLPSDWNRRRKDVLERDGFQCQNCGGSGGPNGSTELHVHHIVPKSKGGRHNKNNLSTVCKDCHLAIHNGEKTAPTTSSGKKTSSPENKHYRRTINKEHRLRIKTRQQSRGYGMLFGIIVGFAIYTTLNVTFIQYMVFSSLSMGLAIYISYRILEYRRGIDVEFKKVLTR
jgi:hypothetical protein